MKLKDLLFLVQDVAKKNNISTPYVVGGLPRDVLLKKIDKIKDIDITCGDATSLVLGQKVVLELEGSTVTTFSDGHSQLSYKGFSVDFSNNFVLPNIQNEIIKFDINNPTPMQLEIYSRDFTINTLLMPLDFTTIIDTTGNGIKDLNKKIVDTCLDPDITLKNDPKRIIRVVYLCAKLGFVPSARVVLWVQKNSSLMLKCNVGYIKGKVDKSLKFDRKYTIDLLKKLNLIDYIPQKNMLVETLI